MRRGGADKIWDRAHGSGVRRCPSTFARLALTPEIREGEGIGWENVHTPLKEHILMVNV